MVFLEVGKSNVLGTTFDGTDGVERVKRVEGDEGAISLETTQED